VTKNKDFRTLCNIGESLKTSAAVQKSKSVSELIGGTSKLLRELRERLDARSELLLQVRATLPQRLIDHVVSAGLDDGCLTLGTISAAWASRLRYVKNDVLTALNEVHDLKVATIKIRVTNPRPGPTTIKR
jgi:hypothetical protein